MKILTLFIGLIIFPLVGQAQILKTCGVTNIFGDNQCGTDSFEQAHVYCDDGYKVVLGDSYSCKPFETWKQYAEDACANHCMPEKESDSFWGFLPEPVTPPIGSEKEPKSTPEPEYPITFKRNDVVTVISSCDEVMNLEKKIAYYGELRNLSDGDLEKEIFSRQEIEKIMEELLFNLKKKGSSM